MAVKSGVKRSVIGLMSGTSSDGVSACLVEITGNYLKTQVELRAYETYPYDKRLRETLLGLTNTSQSPIEEVARLNMFLGKLFADAAANVVRKAGVQLREIDLIGSHGHTIIHRPQQDPKSLRRKNRNETCGSDFSFTLQIGEPSVIAHETGITTVADFRMRDVAAGGGGAPLVPYVDYLLFRHPTLSRAVQNIGGIANVTFLPRGCTINTNDIIAFDTGPGNMIIDHVTRIITNGKHDYDDGGALAEKGEVNEELLSRLMNHPYLTKTLPKSTGREDFGAHFADKLYKEAQSESCNNYSILATVTAFTAKSIAESYQRFIMPRHEVSEVILCGGGSQNHTLVKFLRKFLKKVPVRMIEEFGIPSQAKEPLSFAVLANETICGNPGNIPGATGARERVVLGKVVPGRNWKDIVHKR
ncbi:MAG TPA: anhydro-N-acetylmuramic acid kinase [Candidatus Avalokitesvara rifleensis]|uniref:anhydro-N-acetylmuramic acid kinase n=1 Tax=Candidatus Avalokitesvara rifleensis TaxID=3367620 RepID=UPI0040265720